MDKTSISKRIRALAEDASKRSTIAQLRDVFDDVEAALAAGVKRVTILEELSNLGIKMSLATFDSNLKRIRKKRVATKARPQTADKAPVEPDNSKTSAGGAMSTSHNPTDIDKILGSNPDLAALARKAKKRST